MSTMEVKLVSVERAIWDGEATAVFARTPVGELGILPGHQPLLGALEPGFTVRIDREDGDSLQVAVHGGFLSVRKDGVSVLAEMAEEAGDIDVARARAAFDRTKDDDSPEGMAANKRAQARLRAAGESV